MLVLALFLSVLTLTLGWLNLDLWRRRPSTGSPVLLGITSTSTSGARDGLDPLRSVALVGLVGALGVTFHVWGDKVINYSAERVDQITVGAARTLSDRDGRLDTIDRSDVEDALAEEADLDKLLVLEAASADGDTTLWQISDDDGGSPHCLKVVAPTDDRNPRWIAIVAADVC